MCNSLSYFKLNFNLKLTLDYLSFVQKLRHHLKAQQ